MAFSSNNYEQLGFAGRFLNLNDRERKILDASWAGAFAQDIFPAIDETIFIPLYSQESGSPSNPVNVTVGALILQQIFDLNDDELVEALICDMRFQYALHTESRSDQPVSARSLRRFRKRCQDRKMKTGEDFFHICISGFAGRLDAFLTEWFHNGLQSSDIENAVLKNKDEEFDVRILSGTEPVEALPVPADRRNEISLNGTWKFDFAVNYDNAVKEFEKNAFDCSLWDEITVPGAYEIPEEKHPVLTDSQIPWDGLEEVRTGKYPRRYNPVGSYIRSFLLPEEMLQSPVFLSFDQAEGGIAVWINGRYAGYCDSETLPAALDVSGLVRAGINRAAVRIFKWTGRTGKCSGAADRLEGLAGNVCVFNAGEPLNPAADHAVEESDSLRRERSKSVPVNAGELRLIKGRNFAGISGITLQGDAFEDLIDLKQGRICSCTKDGREIFTEKPFMNFWNEKCLEAKPSARLLQWKTAADYAFLCEDKEPSLRRHKDHISAGFEFTLPVMPQYRCSVIYRFYAFGRIEITMEMTGNEEDTLPPEFGMRCETAAESAASISSSCQQDGQKLQYTLIIKR